MPEGLGGIIFNAAEKGIEHSPLSHDTGKVLHDFIDNTFSLNSKLTGTGGEVIGKMLKSFEGRKDYHLSLVTKNPGQYIKDSLGNPITNPEPHQIMSTAVQKARTEVFGQKHEHLARALAVVKQEHGPYGEEKIKDLTDHLGVYFHDQMYHSKNNRWTSAIPADLSKFKPFAETQFKPSPYQAPGAKELIADKIASGAFAYKAGLAHAPQAFVNSLFNARASSLLKATSELFGKGYNSAKAQLIASNAVGNLVFHEYAQQFNFKGSAIFKFAPGSVGEFVHKNYLIPGIDSARNMGMVVSGLVGKYDALYAAHAVANGMEKRGSLALERMGINWRDVQSRGGQLTQGELEKAMRSMIRENMFTDRGTAQNKIAAATPVGRLFTIFHSFTNMQSRLIVESMKRNLFQAHDLPMLLQNLTALAVVVPTVGNAIYSIDEAWTGRNEHPIDNFVGREKAIYSAHNTAEIMKAVSHMGGFGMAMGMVNAASRYRLAKYFMGAPISATLEGLEDAAKAASSDEQHPHAADAFKRDLLHDIPTFGLGAYIANTSLPNKVQRDAARPMTVRRIKAKAAAARRKARAH